MLATSIWRTCQYVFNSSLKISRSRIAKKLCFFHKACQFSERSTIYALSTASGMSAIAVIRISGPNAAEVLYRIGKLRNLPEPRKTLLCRLKDPETNEVLDKALTLWFPSPNSFTGEDLCELHIHGGIAVIKSVLNALQKLPHFRLAEPGEFTKRAFMAGKLDLTEVEGLADLLHAATEAQQKQALMQMEGVLHRLYSDWTNRLKKCLARVEAFIDFSEDQHLDDSILKSVQNDLGTLQSELSVHLQDKRKGEKLRSGICTVLVGKPNVGKSSLLNSLCQRDIAIVSSTAGTTRDIIESSLNLGGYLVNICDTAGLRETQNEIEQEGVKRARERSSQADLLIFILEARGALNLMKSKSFHGQDLVNYLMQEELQKNTTQDTRNLNGLVPVLQENSSVILVFNKTDLLDNAELRLVKELENFNPLVCGISCIDGSGMNKLVNLLADRIEDLCCGHRGEEPAITQERHRYHVQNCLQNILDFEGLLQVDVAIAAEKLRCAMNELGKITGKIRIDDILDVVFKDFCIGK